jgi:hypothetical protein
VSLQEPSEKIIGLFSQRHPASLQLNVALSGGDASGQTDQPFSEITFAEDGDYYRISLRHTSKDLTWAYFLHPGIYRDVINLFGEAP